MAKRVESSGKSCSVFIPDDPTERPKVTYVGTWSMKDVHVANRYMERGLREYKKELLERGVGKKEISDAG